MAFAAANSSKEARSFSIGPVKIQIMTWSAASADVSGTITADKLSSLDHVLLSGGLALTAQPTYSANVATLAFADPAATVAGLVICIGK
jgi:hypothetical protein